MASTEHLEVLKSPDWNQWRAGHPGITPDLTDISLVELDLSGRDLSGADL